MSGDGILIAVESAAFEFEGRMVIVHKGRTRVREGHSILKGRAHLFAPIDVHFDVEQATARPAEKRTSPRRGRGKGKPANAAANVGPVVESPADPSSATADSDGSNANDPKPTEAEIPSGQADD